MCVAMSSNNIGAFPGDEEVFASAKVYVQSLESCTRFHDCVLRLCTSVSLWVSLWLIHV